MLGIPILAGPFWSEASLEGCSVMGDTPDLP